ncbi:MAG TPA: class I SAM-dependent methyltransferase [Phycisphaerae bacterium]|nr:class I SAM-dependent methyltransferase [Phycisphaerae bacterium]
MSFEIAGDAPAAPAAPVPEGALPAPVFGSATAGHFNPLEHPPLFLEPRLISDTSAWIGHIPLAFLLIDLLRPRCVVELGTQRGDSYCAFCQAIDTLGLAGAAGPAAGGCEATAIDTWSGDPQSGAADAATLATLRAHHDPLYGRFSTLLQSSFDEALPRFADRSIDLLHIDGRHDYASVRHDFYAWRPKLSDAAVVIFHDTHLRRPGFDVHRLWDELCASYPHVAFGHFCGLGLLAVGERLPAPFRNFLADARERASAVEMLLAHLGQRIELLRAQRLLCATVREQAAAAGAWRLATGQPPRASDVGTQSAASAVADDLVAAALDAANVRMSLRRTRQKLARARPLHRWVRRLLGLGS